MPLKTKPVCSKCEKTESPMWQMNDNGILCIECDKELNEQNDKSNLMKQDNQDDNQDAKSNENGSSKAPRRSTRNTRQYKTRLNPFALPKAMLPKGKGRRVIFKKTPMKAPTAVSTPITSDSVFFKGSYIQVGDIVSMLDENDDVYYAQIRGLLTDQYCEKSAVITWLLPTEESPPPHECFDPATYIIGPDEDIPRKLECMDFIMHAPSEYFKTKNTPYPIVNATPSPGFIWTNLRPVDKIYSNKNNIYNINNTNDIHNIINMHDINNTDDGNMDDINNINSDIELINGTKTNDEIENENNVNQEINNGIIEYVTECRDDTMEIDSVETKSLMNEPEIMRAMDLGKTKGSSKSKFCRRNKHYYKTKSDKKMFYNRINIDDNKRNIEDETKICNRTKTKGVKTKTTKDIDTEVEIKKEESVDEIVDEVESLEKRDVEEMEIVKEMNVEEKKVDRKIEDVKKIENTDSVGEIETIDEMEIEGLEEAEVMVGTEGLEETSVKDRTEDVEEKETEVITKTEILTETESLIELATEETEAVIESESVEGAQSETEANEETEIIEGTEPTAGVESVEDRITIEVEEPEVMEKFIEETETIEEKASEIITKGVSIEETDSKEQNVEKIVEESESVEGTEYVEEMEAVEETEHGETEGVSETEILMENEVVTK